MLVTPISPTFILRPSRINISFPLEPVTCRNIRQGTYEVPKIGKREVEDDAPLSDIRKRRRSERQSNKGLLIRCLELIVRMALVSPSPSSPPLSSTTKKSRTDASSPARSDVSKAHSSVPPPKNPKTKKQQEKERKEEKKGMFLVLNGDLFCCFPL